MPESLQVTSEDSESRCACLKSDPGLTGSTMRHVEILEFIGGSVKYLKLIQNKYPFW